MIRPRPSYRGGSGKMHSPRRPRDGLRRALSPRAAVREPSRHLGAVWLSRFVFDKLSYYFLDKFPQRLL